MERLNKKNFLQNKLILCFIAFTITFITINVIYFVYGFAPFGNGTLACMDADIQYLDLFAYFKDVLLGKNNISYTLSDTLGGDMLSVFSYYLASPFNLLVIFFEKEHLIVFFNLVVALKLSTSAFTMMYFLKSIFEQEIDSVYAILLSLSYAFMQYNIAQSSNVMWLDGAYMLPLMILGVHKAVKYKKIVLLSITTALCIIFNWYAAGMCCLFSIIWFFFECAIEYFGNNHISKKEKIENFFFETLCYGGGMVIAVLISACFFLPTIFSLFGGKGISENVNFSFAGNVSSVLANYHIGSVSSYGSPSLYAGSFVLLGAISYFIHKGISKEKKVINAILLFVSVFIYFWGPLDFIFSLLRTATSYYYRYSFVSIFPIIYISASSYVCYKQDKQEGKFVKIGLIFSAFLCLCNYFKSMSDIKYIYYTIFSFIIVSVLVAAYEKNTIRKKHLISGMLILGVVFELAFNTKTLWLSFYSEFNENTQIYQMEQTEQINELKEYDKSDYRISQSISRTAAGYNESLAYDYWSNTGYTSCPENIQLDFLDRLGYRTEGKCITIANTTVLAADSLLGVKYILTDAPVNGLLECEELSEYNNKKVYENPYVLPMVFITDSFNQKELVSENSFEYHNDLYSQLLGENISLYEKISYERIVEEDGIHYIIDLPKGNYAVYGNIPFNVSCESTLTVNKEYELSYAGWLSQSVFYIPTEESDTLAEVSLITDNIDNFEEPQFYALDLDVLAEVTEKLSSQPITDIELGSDEINYEITVDSDKYLYLSIPYSDGWTIKVNGTDTDPMLLGDCMMVIPLTAGTNVIDMDYEIPGLKLGICITVVGIVMLIAWGLISKNKKLLQWMYNIITSSAMRYIIVGGCTTLVNLGVFTVLCKVINLNVTISNVISIICAILFAYVTNKIFVFESKCSSKKEVIIEMAKFVGARISTMIIEVGGVFLLYNIIKQDELLAKLETQVIVLVVNYFISKFLVFRTKEEEK